MFIRFCLGSCILQNAYLFSLVSRKLCIRGNVAGSTRQSITSLYYVRKKCRLSICKLELQGMEPLFVDCGGKPTDGDVLSEIENSGFKVDPLSDDSLPISPSDHVQAVLEAVKTEIQEEPWHIRREVKKQVTSKECDGGNEMVTVQGDAVVSRMWVIECDMFSENGCAKKGSVDISDRELGSNSRKSKSYKCEVCKKVFSRSNDLKRHANTHTGQKLYTCVICNKALSQYWSLVRHQRCHTGEKPYECDICSTAFARSEGLTEHRRIHTGEKPYVCEVCNKGFCQSGHLAKHRRSHTGEKPYVCEICNKSFSTSETLVEHKRIHTGERPYKCDYCEKTFCQSGHLTKHRRTHKSAQ